MAVNVLRKQFDIIHTVVLMHYISLIVHVKKKNFCMNYSLNSTTCFGQGRPSSGHQEPGYALYNICFNYVMVSHYYMISIH